MSTKTTTAPAEEAEARPGIARQIAESNALMGLLAVVTAMIVGSVLILIADPDVRVTAGYFFARPSDFLGAVGTSLTEAYTALLRGGIFDWQASTPARMWRPITETLTVATPLILAGLGMAVAFRAGLFNVGGQGQIILGAMLGGYIGFTFHLPAGLGLVAAVLGTVVGGMLWGAIPGLLKALTGASEVITTIMLNSISTFLLAHALTTDAFIGEGNANPKSLPVLAGSQYPRLLGDSFRLHLGFLVALAAAVFVWWLLERSEIGFQFRATGLNPEAARTAGAGHARLRCPVRPGRLRAGAGYPALPDYLHRRVSRLRRDDRGPARALQAPGHSAGWPALRCPDGRRHNHAGRHRYPDRHRAGAPVHDRAVHRGAPARPRHLPPAGTRILEALAP